MAEEGAADGAAAEVAPSAGAAEAEAARTGVAAAEVARTGVGAAEDTEVEGAHAGSCPLDQAPTLVIARAAESERAHPCAPRPADGAG